MLPRKAFDGQHIVSLARSSHQLAALEDRRSKSEFPGDEKATTLTLNHLFIR
jgi:hypothetical protein